MSHMSTKAGFTIVELIVVITVLGILSGLVFFTLGDFYNSNTRTLGVTTQDTDTRSSLRQIDTDVATSTKFANATTVANPLGPTLTGPTWNYSLDQNKMVLITSTPAYASSAAASPGTVLYNKNAGGSCTNDPLVDSISYVQSIYFVGPNPSSGQNSLFRRTVVDPNICAGSGVAQKTTCAASVSRSVYPVCQGADAVIVDNVQSFKLRFFELPTSPTPITIPADIDTKASTVEITITTKPAQANIPASTAVVRINLAKL